MSAILTAGPRMKLAVVSRAFDSEGRDFADDLALTLNNAQWEAVRHDNWTRGDSGVFIATVDGTPVPAEASALRAALDAGGIAYRPIDYSQRGYHADVAVVSPQRALSDHRRQALGRACQPATLTSRKAAPRCAR